MLMFMAAVVAAAAAAVAAEAPEVVTAGLTDAGGKPATAEEAQYGTRGAGRQTERNKRPTETET